MITQTNTVPFDETAIALRLPEPEKCVFFDIETTGFNPGQTQLYLIGLAYKSDDGWRITQLLAENASEERVLLLTFAQLIRPFSQIVSFAGEQFDIGYLNAKYKAFDLPSPLDEKESIDIYKDLRQMRRFLQMSHMNQTSLERYVGLKRKDPYDGGTLINVYKEYLKTHDTTLRDTFMLHNYEDVLGMQQVMKMYAFDLLLHWLHEDVTGQIIGGAGPSGKECRALAIRIHLPYPVPALFTREHEYMQITARDSECEILVSLYEGEMLYFFENYKDYVYLPAEDQAVHKDIAKYVDKDHRRPAKRENCYIRKSGTFLPEPTEHFTPAFKRMYGDSMRFFEVKEGFEKDSVFLAEYVQLLLSIF